MEIKIKGKDLVFIVVKGKIDLSCFPFLEEKLEPLYEKGYKVIIFDFSCVTGIDSTGLGKLLMLQKKLKGCGIELRIINVKNEYTRKMFKALHLYKVIQIEDGLGTTEKS